MAITYPKNPNAGFATLGAFTQPAADGSATISYIGLAPYLGAVALVRDAAGVVIGVYTVTAITLTTLTLQYNVAAGTVAEGDPVAAGMVLVVVGEKGAKGDKGDDGTIGVSAFTMTTATFTQPAVGSAQIVSVESTAWTRVGAIVFEAAGGYYEVIALDASSLTLKNLGYPGGSSPGATIGGLLVAAGKRGADGAAGAAGPAGDGYSLDPVTLAPAAASTSRTNGTYTTGVKINVTTTRSMTGFRFWWTGANATVTCTIWNNAGTQLGQASMTAVAGLNTLSLGSPITLTADELYTIGMYGVGAYVFINPTAGTSMKWGIAKSYATGGWMGGGVIAWDLNLYVGSANTKPTTSAAAELYVVWPILT